MTWLGSFDWESPDILTSTAGSSALKKVFKYALLFLLASGNLEPIVSKAQQELKVPATASQPCCLLTAAALALRYG